MTSGPHERAERIEAAFGPRPTKLPDSAPLYMRRDNERLMAAWESIDALVEYSPGYQDEYQRLWHEAAAARDAALAELDQAREAHKQLGEWAQAHADKLQREWDDDYGPEGGEPAPWQTTYYKPLYDALAALAGSAASGDESRLLCPNPDCHVEDYDKDYGSCPACGTAPVVASKGVAKKWSDVCPACKGYPDQPHTYKEGMCYEQKPLEDSTE